MYCPYCRKEMEKGYIKSGQQLLWGKEKELGIGAFDEDNIRLSQTFWKGFHGFYVESYFCSDCNIIITQVNKKDKEEK